MSDTKIDQEKLSATEESRRSSETIKDKGRLADLCVDGNTWLTVYASHGRTAKENADVFRPSLIAELSAEKGEK